MKKIIIILLASILFANSVQGQLAKGTWMIGGNAALTTYNTHYPVGTQNGTSVSIMPAIGYFVMEKLAVGISPSYELDAIKINDFRSPTNQYYALGPFVRYYLLPADNIVNLFTDGSFQYTIDESRNSTINSYSIFIGTSAFFNSSVAIEMSAGFSYLTTKNHITDSFFINAGFQVYLKKQ